MSRFVKSAPDSLLVETYEVPWLPFKWSEGGLRWKLLFTSPGDQRWTAMWRGPKGAYLYPHLHTSEAEGMLLYGQIGPNAAPNVSSEPEDRTVWVRELGKGGRHQRTTLQATDTCFFLTVFGPIRWIHEQADGTEKYTDVTAADVQAMWDEQYAEHMGQTREKAAATR